MKVVSPQELCTGWVVNRLSQSQLVATFICKSEFILKPGQPAMPSEQPANLCGDTHYEDAPERSLIYSSDFAPVKPRAEVLLVGTGYAPGGRAAPFFPISLRVGSLHKSLEVFGNRTWKSGILGAKPGEVRPILKLPLVYENAWGGKGFKQNPVGRGRRTSEMPNVEWPLARITSRGANIPPAGFGPLDASWEPRRSKVGTYKGKWLKERWPWFPNDFDWSYYNAAPADQQLEGYLRGDEELVLENLHPEQTIYRSRLPGLRARCFVNERLAAEEFSFREVQLNLDTLWINTDQEKLILIWRGTTAVRSLKLREIEHLLTFTEPLSNPVGTLDEHKATLQRYLEAAKSSGLVEESPAAHEAALAKELAEMEKEAAQTEQEFAQLEAELARAEADHRAELRAEGLSAEAIDGPAHPQSFAEARAQIEAALAESKLEDPELAHHYEAPELAEIEQAIAEMEQAEKELEAGEPAPPTRQAIAANLSSGKCLANQRLSELDLSGLDFSGQDLSGAELVQANLQRANLAGAKLQGASLRGANLTGADLTGAVLDGADLSEATLVDAKLAGVSVTHTTFSGLELAGADFSRAKGIGVDFSQANLAGARFIGARLPRANFSEASLEKADFRSAEIPAAQFEGAKARGACWEEADLSGLHGGGNADFAGGNFRRVKGAGSIWEQSSLDDADFCMAILTRASFSEASLRNTRFDRADASKASFDDACLRSALLTNANLLRASFDRADLTQAVLSHSNLYEAGFWETLFQDTVVQGANVHGTLIA